MKTFPPSELVRFLDAVDEHLGAKITLTLVGGSAASLAYGIETATKDIDTWDAGGASARLERAVRLAQAATGLDIPFGPAGVADAPYDFEARVVPVLADRGWRHLRLFALERHDLVLSKLVRGGQGDIEHIVAIHQVQPLDFEILIERFLGEMQAAVTHPKSLRLNFLWGIEALFGELAREEALQRISDAG